MTWFVLIGAASMGAAARAVSRNEISIHRLPSKWFVATYVITFIALLWWELVAYGLFSKRPILRG